jgi:hypothetical protein
MGYVSLIITSFLKGSQQIESSKGSVNLGIIHKYQVREMCPTRTPDSS